MYSECGMPLHSTVPRSKLSASFRIHVPKAKRMHKFSSEIPSQSMGQISNGETVTQVGFTKEKESFRESKKKKKKHETRNTGNTPEIKEKKNARMQYRTRQCN